jgi:hypothetical protein
MASSLDAVVFVARGSGGERRVEAIAEVDACHPDGARALFVRRGDRLIPIARVNRPARRQVATRVEERGPSC